MLLLASACRLCKHRPLQAWAGAGSVERLQLGLGCWREQWMLRKGGGQVTRGCGAAAAAAAVTGKTLRLSQA
jgi:hypothetical protein